MTIIENRNDECLILHVTGRIDTYTAEAFEKVLLGGLDQVEQVTIDFEEVDYVSSAGLRALLNGQKKANNLDKEMICKNINEIVEEVLESTGFIDILTVE